MQLTVSTLTLAAHSAHDELLWYCPEAGGHIYWAAAAGGDEDIPLATADELLHLAPADGSRVLQVETLGWSYRDPWAERLWLSEAVDLVVVEGMVHWPQARLFGPLRHGVVRPRIGERWEGDSLACLPGGLWHWVPADGAPAISTSWRGAMGMMM